MRNKIVRREIKSIRRETKIVLREIKSIQREKKASGPETRYPIHLGSESPGLRVQIISLQSTTLRARAASSPIDRRDPIHPARHYAVPTPQKHHDEMGATLKKLRAITNKNSTMDTTKPVESLVLDAAPLITQSASALQQFATTFYTTPGVRAELRDEHTRNQLLLWGDALKVRQPKQVHVDTVSAFAKLTGDYSVLSMNDVHIIALAYELEFEKNGGARLRKFPGEKLEGEEETERKPRRYEERKEEPEEKEEDDDGFQTVVRKKKVSRKWRYKQHQTENAKAHENIPETQFEAAETPTEAAETPTEDFEGQVDAAETFEATETPTEASESQNEPVEETGETDNSENAEKAEDTMGEPAEGDAALSQEYDEEDDDGEWITPENLQEELLRDNNETVHDRQPSDVITVALSSGDFACQNVTMQLGLKLMNYVSGKQIKRVRNYMYRCHACFSMSPMPKSGQAKHFCSRCGGNTLLRCAVSIDDATGKVTPHLKRNFQWITRGQVYSILSPLSKNLKKQQGNRGYQHNKENRHKNLQDPLILREDQKEYAQAIKDDAWHRKKSEKTLLEWIGGGSADNYMSPFTTNYRSSGVRVGRGRNANAVKSKRK